MSGCHFPDRKVENLHVSSVHGIETEPARIKETEKERRKGNVGNPPLCRISNNPDTN